MATTNLVTAFDADFAVVCIGRDPVVGMTNEHQIAVSIEFVACIDDPVVKSLLPGIKRSGITFVLDQDADFQACEEQQNETISLIGRSVACNRTDQPSSSLGEDNTEQTDMQARARANSQLGQKQ